MQEAAVFIVVTLALVFVSRASLRKPGSHGFYRFFAWECMLGLFVMNMRVWYVGTNTTHQIISGILFTASLFLVLFSVGLLQQFGKLDTRRDDAPLYEFEKTTTLVTAGVYRYIRHPMYVSLLFLCWGFFFKQPSLAGGILAVIANGFMVIAARAEEIENIRYFGEAYRKYMERTKMFVPFIL